MAAYNAQGQVTQLVNEQGNGANGLTRQFVYNANTLWLDSLNAGTTATYDNRPQWAALLLWRIPAGRALRALVCQSAL